MRFLHNRREDFLSTVANVITEKPEKKKELVCITIYIAFNLDWCD